MAVETVSTNIYTCDYCGIQTTEAPSGWFQVWVINVMDPKHFHTATCALNMLTAANVAPEINIVVEDVPEEDRNPAPPNPGPFVPVDPEPATPEVVEPATPEVAVDPVNPVPEPEVVEPTPEPEPNPNPPPDPEPAVDPEPEPEPEPEPTPEPAVVVEEEEEEPPLDPEEPQPAE